MRHTMRALLLLFGGLATVQACSGSKQENGTGISCVADGVCQPQCAADPDCAGGGAGGAGNLSSGLDGAIIGAAGSGSGGSRSVDSESTGGNPLDGSAGSPSGETGGNLSDGPPDAPGSQSGCGNGVCASTETSQSCPADCTPTLTCGATSCTVQACNWTGNTTVHNGTDIEANIAVCVGKLPAWFNEMDCFVNDYTYNAMKNFTGSPKLCSPGYAYCLCLQGSMQWAVQIMPTANFEQSVARPSCGSPDCPGASGSGGASGAGGAGGSGCATGCLVKGVCCGGAMCAGDCVGTPCCT
jgi:hypothetical protein